MCRLKIEVKLPNDAVFSSSIICDSCLSMLLRSLVVNFSSGLKMTPFALVTVKLAP